MWVTVTLSKWSDWYWMLRMNFLFPFPDKKEKKKKVPLGSGFKWTICSGSDSRSKAISFELSPSCYVKRKTLIGFQHKIKTNDENQPSQVKPGEEGNSVMTKREREKNKQKKFRILSESTWEPLGMERYSTIHHQRALSASWCGDKG